MNTHTCEPLLRDDSGLSGVVFIKDLLFVCPDRAALDSRGKRAHIVAHRYIGLDSRAPRQKRERNANERLPRHLLQNDHTSRLHAHILTHRAAEIERRALVLHSHVIILLLGNNLPAGKYI